MANRSHFPPRDGDPIGGRRRGRLLRREAALCIRVAMKPRARSTNIPVGAAAAGLVAALAGFVPLSAASAREALGVFSGWGAFRDPGPPARCFAIAEPVRRGGGERWRPFLALGFWPASAVRGQLNVRLSHRKERGTPVTLVVGDRRFALIAGGSDAWAPNPRVDAAIVGAIRSATSLTIEAQARGGRAFADAYALRGVATAIDAAALGCARP